MVSKPTTQISTNLIFKIFFHHYTRLIIRNFNIIMLNLDNLYIMQSITIVLKNLNSISFINNIIN
jgi:hypothetical protein